MRVNLSFLKKQNQGVYNLKLVINSFLLKSLNHIIGKSTIWEGEFIAYHRNKEDASMDETHNSL